MKDILGMMAQVGRLGQNSAKFGKSWFVTATQLNLRVRTASGVKKKIVNEVSRKCGIRVK
jgi:hypothetical protein